MSLYGMMKTGVSGMNAQSNRLSTVADNIANSSTNGYKRASTEFSTLVVPSTQGSYNSGGVTTTVRYSISDQGVLNYTTSVSDLALQGEGFFRVQDADGRSFLTRAGSFVPNDQGQLVNAAGYFLMGTRPGGTVAEPITIPTEPLMPTASTEGVFSANLPADAEIGFTQGGSISYVDKSGNVQVLSIQFEKIAESATGESQWQATVNGEPPVSTTVTFDPASDQLTAQETITVALPQNQEIALDFSLSQTGREYELIKAEANGSERSEIETIQIDARGVVYAQYESGAFVPIYDIQFGTVASPDQLEVLSGNVFAQSPSSGNITYGKASEIGAGRVVSGALEGSNVDIAQELTDMIQSQRDYTANSKVFQTGSQLLELLVNLK